MEPITTEHPPRPRPPEGPPEAPPEPAGGDEAPWSPPPPSRKRAPFWLSMAALTWFFLMMLIGIALSIDPVPGIVITPTLLLLALALFIKARRIPIGTSPIRHRAWSALRITLYVLCVPLLFFATTAAFDDGVPEPSATTPPPSKTPDPAGYVRAVEKAILPSMSEYDKGNEDHLDYRHSEAKAHFSEAHRIAMVEVSLSKIAKQHNMPPSHAYPKAASELLDALRTTAFSGRACMQEYEESPGEAPSSSWCRTWNHDESAMFARGDDWQRKTQGA